MVIHSLHSRLFLSKTILRNYIVSFSLEIQTPNLNQFTLLRYSHHIKKKKGGGETKLKRSEPCTIQVQRLRTFCWLERPWAYVSHLPTHGHLNCSRSRRGQKILYSVLEESCKTGVAAILARMERKIAAVALGRGQLQ